MRFVSGLWWRLIRFGFRLLYNELASTYDVVSKVVSLGAWHCWQRTSLTYLDDLDNPLVLELAHGTGDLQIDLRERGYRTVGYDLSPHMGRIAANKLRRRGLATDLIRGRAQQLPFAGGTFQAVIATFPSEFIVAPETLREVHRVLDTDGRFIVVPNGLLLGSGPVRNVLEWLYRITGQREAASNGNSKGLIEQGKARVDERLTAHFDGYGFETQIFYHPCIRNTEAQVVLARKKV